MVNTIHHFTGRTPCPAAEVSNNMPSGCMNFIRTKYYSLITEWPCWAQALRPEGSGGNLARFFDFLLECHREQTTYTDAYSDAVTTKTYKTTTKTYKTTRKAAAFVVVLSFSLSLFLLCLGALMYPSPGVHCPITCPWWQQSLIFFFSCPVCMRWSMKWAAVLIGWHENLCTHGSYCQTAALEYVKSRHQGINGHIFCFTEVTLYNMFSLGCSNETSLLTPSFHSVAWFCISVPLSPGWNCLTPTSPAAHWSSWSGTTPSHQSAWGLLITSSARRRWQRGATTPKLRQVSQSTSRVWPLMVNNDQHLENCGKNGYWWQATSG